MSHTSQKTLNLDSLKDQEILQLVKHGHRQASEHLVEKYKGYVRAKARTYYVIGSDREDVIQEGMIGLYKAMRNFDGDKLASFKVFAELCITRQMITAIKAATRQKHIPLNSYVSLDKPLFEGESDRTLFDVIAESTTADPQDVLVNREKFTDINQQLEGLLSRFEHNVLFLYIDGYTYEEISVELKTRVKSIDNALQRVKRKLESVVEASPSEDQKHIV